MASKLVGKTIEIVKDIPDISFLKKGRRGQIIDYVGTNCTGHSTRMYQVAFNNGEAWNLYRHEFKVIES